MKKVFDAVFRWFGYVPVARLIRLEDEHKDELLREASERALIAHQAARAVKRAESVQAGQVRVIERLLEDRMAGVV